MTNRVSRRALPDRDTLLTLLSYDPETGRLTWLPRDKRLFHNGYFTAEQSCASWNAKNAGNQAFTACNGHHSVGAVNRQLYLAHRIIWKMVYGTEPTVIDHINGNPTDNRISNLREVTQKENSRNSARPSNNSSGVTGVGWHKQVGKWRAYITVDGTQRSLGLFETKDEAIHARKSAEAQFDFHDNHGRAAA